jgi:hypothetical protein
LRRLCLGLADDDLAGVGELAVSPIGEPGGGEIDVDARRRRVAVEPAQSFHCDRYGARPIGIREVEDCERLGSNDAVGLDAIVGLHALHRLHHRRPIGVALRGATAQIVGSDKLARDRRDARVARARLERLCGIGDGRLGRVALFAQRQIGFGKTSIIVVLRREPRKPVVDLALGESVGEACPQSWVRSRHAVDVVELRRIGCAASERGGVAKGTLCERGLAFRAAWLAFNGKAHAVEAVRGPAVDRFAELFNRFGGPPRIFGGGAGLCGICGGIASGEREGEYEQ